MWRPTPGRLLTSKKPRPPAAGPMSLPALLGIISLVCDEKQAADTNAHLNGAEPPSTLTILQNFFRKKFGTGAAVVKAKVESVRASCELHSDAPRVEIFRGMVRGYNAFTCTLRIRYIHGTTHTVHARYMHGTCTVHAR